MPEDLATTTESPNTGADMTGVIAYLSLDGRAAEAVDFYTRAFGAEEVGRLPDADNPGRLMHAHLRINGGSLMMTDCRAPWESGESRPQGFNLMLVVPDGDRWFERAVAAGCTVRMPLERMFWGDRWGMVEDPFGLQWAIDEPGA